MSAAGDLASANLPWDGRWTVQAPEDHKPGLYRMHQIDAHELLKSAPLTNAEALFLQVVAYQWRDLSNLQAHWLGKLERTHSRKSAA